MQIFKKYRLGFILALIVIIMFVVVSTFFVDEKYSQTSIFLNAYVIPPLFALLTLFGLLQYKKQLGKLSFKQGFTFCYLNQLIGGLLSLGFILFYLNVLQPEVRDVFNYQFYDRQYKDAIKELKIEDIENFQPIDENQEIQKRYVTNFKTLRDKKDNLFSFQNNDNFFLISILFGMNVFYVMNSIFLSMFFKTPKSEI